MRIDRLEVSTSTDTMELRLHPRITVVTGLGQLEREALTAELASAVGWGRPGLSADLLEDSGRILLVQRPVDQPARIIDALNGENITEEFVTDDHSVSVAGSLGIRRNELRGLMRIGAVTADEDQRTDELIRKLGRLDQERLWAAALTLAEVEVEVAQLSEEPEPETTHEEYVEAIEDCHLAVERARERIEDTRTALTASSGTLAILALLAAMLLHPLAALPFLLLSVGCASVSYWNHRQLELAAQAESEVLNAAGLHSYVNLQLIQVERLTGRPEQRAGTIKLHEIHRFAKECWYQLVGPVPLEWAVAHRREIEAAARGRYPTSAPITNPVEMVDRIRRHLDRAGSVVGESIPAILDDPFPILDDFDVAAVLTSISDHAHTGQVIVMTNDQRVTGWAEQMAQRFAAALLVLGGERRSKAPILDRARAHQSTAVSR